MSTILLNNEPFTFSLESLPCLIHGRPSEGASLLTISTAADLYRQGERLLFLCGYSMAQEEFLKQIERKDHADSRAIFFVKEESKNFIEQTHILPDIKERIIFVKNIELFGPDVFEAVKDFERICFSGNLDGCSFAEKLMSFPFKSRVYFSESQNDKTVVIPSLSKYSGYFVQNGLDGLIRVEQ